MLTIGLVSSILNLAYIGLILMGGSLLFQLITLPVEFNASKRAKEILFKEGLITQQEKTGVNNMLKSAAFTYLSSFFTTLIQGMRLFGILKNKK